jgi:MFS family permease
VSAAVPAERWSDVYLTVTARAISVCGDFLAATALALALQSRGAGGLAVAALMIAAAVPPVVLAPLTGRLADRVDSRLLLVTAGLGQAVICIVLAYLSSPVALIAMTAALAVGLAVTQPTLSALMPSMVSRENLPRASALGQTATSLGIMVAPALGGLLVGRFGLRVPLLIDAASYLAIVLAGLALRTRRGGARRIIGPDRAAPHQPAPAWRVRHDTLLRPMLVMFGAVLAAVSAVNVVELFFVRETMHSAPAVYGLLNAGWTGAMLVGAWLLGRHRLGDAAMSVALVASLAGTCLIVLVASTVPVVGWLVPVYLFGGASNGAENVAGSVVLSRRAPEASRGHAFAIYGAVANGTNAVGFLLGGVLLTVLPVRPLIALIAVAGLLATTAFGVPMLRAAARERAATAEPELAAVS